MLIVHRFKIIACQTFQVLFLLLVFDATWIEPLIITYSYIFMHMLTFQS